MRATVKKSNPSVLRSTNRTPKQKSIDCLSTGLGKSKSMKNKSRMNSSGAIDDERLKKILESDDFGDEKT